MDWLLSNKLPRSDYLGDPFEVAKNLIGCYLCSYIDGQLTAGKITEIEVYTGGEDKASHTYQNRRTKRVESVYKIGGHAYVFLIYGIYHQLCAVAGEKDVPNSLLIRSLEPVFGIETMQKRRCKTNLKGLTTGPGKLCKALGITRLMDGSDLLQKPLWIAPRTEIIKPSQILSSKRIGVDYAGEFAHKEWRFTLKDSSFLSR